MIFLKFQFPSTKLQINHKYQFTMTKTISAVLPIRLAMLAVLEIMPIAQMLIGHSLEFFILVHCDLFEICILVLGIYTTQPLAVAKTINSKRWKNSSRFAL